MQPFQLDIRDPKELIPHRQPMLLLDELVCVTDHTVEARVLVHPDSTFFDGQIGGVPVWVAVEYMAQTIGVWEGARHRLQNKAFQAAFLLGVRDFQARSSGGAADQCAPEYFPEGSVLKVVMKPSAFDEAAGLGVFDCSVSNDQWMWTARVNAFSPDNLQEFIKHIGA